MSRWCSLSSVTHDLMPANASRRPPRALHCRECVKAIALTEAYVYCCRECPPLCVPCFEELSGRSIDSLC